MLVPHRWVFAAVTVLAAAACNSSAGCSGFVAQPPGTYQGPKLDAAGAVRISQHGFATLSSSSGLIKLIAPKGNLDTTVSCDVRSAGLLGSFAIGDQGSVGCTNEACGRADGKCNALDAEQPVSIAVNGVTVNSASPDLIEAKLTATVKTGLIIISSTSRNSALCFGSGPAKCSLDFDSERDQPNTNVLTVQIKLAIRNGLLSIELAELLGTKACGTSGALGAPHCIDPGDIDISRESDGCSVACGTLNTTVVKQLLIDQLTKSLKKDLTKSLEETTCEPCGPSGGLCPTNAHCVVNPKANTGRCIETVGGLCSPRFLGVEGRADLSAASGGVGAPDAAVDLSVALGGSNTTDLSGATLGMRGGFKEVAINPCVAPLTAPAWPNLPLPNFELDAPGTYDLAFSLSGQLMSEALFRAQQSGALCIDLGTDTVTQLDSATLETLLPSLKALSHRENVPLRVVIRPVNPPTVSIGPGTLDSSGQPLDPLLRLTWLGVELDVYAKLEERFVRLFTIATDLVLPLNLNVVSCTEVQPVIGDLMNAVKKVEVKNSELVAENLDVISKLVPTLIKLAQPGLGKGLPKIQIPSLGSEVPLQLKVLQAKGVGQVAGSTQYNHLGIYAQLISADGGCQ